MSNHLFNAIDLILDSHALCESVVENRLSDEEMIPLVLYRGNVGLGTAHALLAYARIMMEIESVRFCEMAEVSSVKALTHPCGLHRKAMSSMQLRMWFSRLHFNRDVTNKISGLSAFVDEVFSRNLFPIELQRIGRYSPWSKRAWRKPIKGPEEIPLEVWPYQNKRASTCDGQALIDRVDACVPKRLPEQIRADVCQDLLVAVLDGAVDIDSLDERASEFTKVVFKQYPLKYGPLSLDHPAPWFKNGPPLKDLISS